MHQDALVWTDSRAHRGFQEFVRIDNLLVHRVTQDLLESQVCLQKRGHQVHLVSAESQAWLAGAAWQVLAGHQVRLGSQGVQANQGREEVKGNVVLQVLLVLLGWLESQGWMERWENKDRKAQWGQLVNVVPTDALESRVSRAGQGNRANQELLE